MTAQADPYVRVYYRVLTDPKFRGLSHAAWGHWVRLLVVADGLYPAPAPLPRWTDDAALAELVTAGIVDITDGDYFLIRGMVNERAARVEAATFAADVKHHGPVEAERRRRDRADAVRPDADRMRPQVPVVRPQEPQVRAHAGAHAEPASPLLSAPLLSTPRRAAGTTGSKRKSDDEELLDRYLNDWAKAPTEDKRSLYAAQLSVMGVKDPAAELSRRAA